MIENTILVSFRTRVVLGKIKDILPLNLLSMETFLNFRMDSRRYSTHFKKEHRKKGGILSKGYCNRFMVKIMK